MKTAKKIQHRFCVAPMMEWTDRHCRYFLRQFSKHTLLYTEMITTGALLHGDAERFLRFNQEEQPVALQLGGSDPGELALAAQMGEKAGYSEINLNAGCPSDRVQRGKIGACLMAEPNLVAECMYAMLESVNIPVTLKCRTGIDELDSLEYLTHFIDATAKAGCRCFIIHARIAVLDGLSPKQNRDIPPLDYERVFAIKERFPELEIVINGGIRSLDESRIMLEKVDGVMVGRQAYQNPGFLSRVDQELFGANYPEVSQQAVLAQFISYARKELDSGTALKHMTRHILGLFQGQPGAEQFRRYLSEHAHKSGADIQILEEAGKLISIEHNEGYKTATGIDMLSTITGFFENHFSAEEGSTETHTAHQLQLASAALMIELCKADQSIDESETNTLVAILKQRFELSEEDLNELMQLAEQEAKEATSLYQFTSLMNTHFEYGEKVQLIQNMWEVAYADGKIDRYEDHLIRQVADLLYLSHKDFIRSKHKARPESDN